MRENIAHARRVVACAINGQNSTAQFYRLGEISIVVALVGFFHNAIGSQQLVSSLTVVFCFTA